MAIPTPSNVCVTYSEKGIDMGRSVSGARSMCVVLTAILLGTTAIVVVASPAAAAEGCGWKGRESVCVNDG